MSRVLPMRLNPVAGIGSNQEAWVTLPPGPTYQQLVVKSNIPADKMNKIMLDLGGKHDEGLIVDVKGSDIIVKDKYKGHFVPTSAPYYYLIELGQLDGKTDAGQMFSGLVTLPGDNIRLLFDQGDLNGVTDPYIEVESYQSGSQAERRYIPYLKTQRIDNNQVGEVVFTDLPTRGNLRVRRLWLNGGDLQKVEVKKDGGTKYEGRKDPVEYMQRVLEKVPQADWFVVDFCERGFVFADLFDPRYRNHLELILQADAAENIRCVVEGVRDLKGWPELSA